MRIAHVHPISLDLYGHRDEQWGTEVRYFLSNLASEQARLGHEPTVHLLSRARRPPTFSVDGVAVRFHRFVGPPARAPLTVQFARQFSRSLLAAIAPRDADLVHFHGALSLHTMLIAAARHASRKGVPLVVHEQGSRRVGPIVGAAHRAALARSAAALAGNEDSVRFFVASGIPPSRVHLVPNGVDRSLFGPVAETRTPGGRGFTLLGVSRLSAEKDPLTFAAAAVELATCLPSLRVRIVGDGSLRGEVEKTLSRSAAAVEFLPHVGQERLAELYRQADAVALTSLSEGSNQVVLEAMASGVPVVASDIAGVRSVTGDAAILVPPRQPSAFAAALARLASDGDEWNRRRGLGLKRAAELGWDAVARRIDEIYEQVLGSSGRTTAGRAVAR